MASVIRRANGTREIQFTSPLTGKSAAIRLGKVTLAQARQVKAYLEDLVSATI
jgi:hypothetical protein